MSDLRLELTGLDVRDRRSYPNCWSGLQRHNAASNRHPMGMDFAANDETCGTCTHSFKSDRWWKCRKCDHTFGPGTDIRVGWPACILWEDDA